MSRVWRIRLLWVWMAMWTWKLLAVLLLPLLLLLLLVLLMHLLLLLHFLLLPRPVVLQDKWIAMVRVRPVSLVLARTLAPCFATQLLLLLVQQLWAATRGGLVLRAGLLLKLLLLRRDHRDLVLFASVKHE